MTVSAEISERLDYGGEKNGRIRAALSIIVAVNGLDTPRKPV